MATGYDFFAVIVQIMFFRYCICFLIESPSSTIRKEEIISHDVNDNAGSVLVHKVLKLRIPSKVTTCELITEPICENGHQTTSLPNIFGDRTQHEAGLSVKRFLLLINSGCSPYLRNFLCSLYFPICPPSGFQNKPILPCRRLCTKARKSCKSVSNKFGFFWPTQLKCLKFPESGLCVAPPHLKKYRKLLTDYLGLGSLGNSRPSSLDNKTQIGKISRVSLPNPNKRINYQKMCAQFCVDIIYITFWVKTLSIVCLLFTICAICVFVSGIRLYDLYPEKIFFWLTVCYLVMSTAYLLDCLDKERTTRTSAAQREGSGNSINGCYSHYYKNSTKFSTWIFFSYQKNETVPTNNTKVYFSLQDNEVKNDCKNDGGNNCSHIFYFIIENISMVSGCLCWMMSSVSSYYLSSCGRDFFKRRSIIFHLVVLFGTFISFIFFLILALTRPLYFNFVFTFYSMFYRFFCLIVFVYFKTIKELINIPAQQQQLDMEEEVTRPRCSQPTTDWNKNMRLFSEICVIPFFIIAFCRILELYEENNNLEKNCFEFLDDIICYRMVNNNQKNILKVKYFMIFFPGMASGFCMLLNCKKNFRSSYDNNDAKEINL